MPIVTQDWRGVIIELNNDETNRLLAAINPLSGTGGASGTTAALVAMGVSATAAGIVGAALALHVAWEYAAIAAMNQGNGVILTAPWLAPGVVIPATRFPSDINENWVSTQNGTFVSAGGDRINYLVESGVEGLAVVIFRLVNQTQSGWDKTFILRDGEGSQWEVPSTVARFGQEGLYANQVLNGQQITFRKPSFFGIWINVISVGGLAALQGGDRATFTWVQD
jgi:hypothetical protein